MLVVTVSSAVTSTVIGVLPTGRGITPLAEPLVTATPLTFTDAPGCSVVGVTVKDALRQLAQAGRLSRELWQGRYLYCAPDGERRRLQWATRQAQEAPGDDMQAAKALFYSLLDERQRRLYAGLESLQCGRGGQRLTAERFGLDVDTVARGERELLSGQVLRGRVREQGAGRPAVEKKRLKS